MRVQVRGQVYDSVKEAAQAHNVCTGTVYLALDRGRPDTIGLGSNRSGKTPKTAKPFTIEGVTFASQQAASKALGRSPSYIAVVLRSKSPVQMESLRRRVRQYAQENNLWP